MNPKIPKIDLSGIPRVNPEPLRQRLKTFRNHRAEIDNAKQRLAALKAEVEDFLDKIDPDDQKSLQAVSAKRLQLEILPRMIAKFERQLEEDMAPALLSETDNFKAGLVGFYGEAHAAFAAAYADLFRRYFSGTVDVSGARTDRVAVVALQTDDCREVLARKSEAESVRLPVHGPRSNNPVGFDRDICDAADALLALAERS